MSDDLPDLRTSHEDRDRVVDVLRVAAGDGRLSAEVCPAVQDWRARSLAAGEPVIPAPWPLADCPATFGNTDVWSATTG